MATFSGVRRARKLPDHGVRNGWYDTLPSPPHPRVVTATVTVDYAILGAGACGLAVARRLGELRPDDSIAVVEAMRVGYGTSGRNAGFMLSHHSHGGIKDLDAGRRSDQLFGHGYNYLRETIERHQIRCDWTEWGQLYVAADPSGDHHLRAVAAGFDGLKVPFKHVDRDAIEEITGTHFYHAGVHVEGAALVQPAAMMRGLGSTLPPNVTLFEDSPVTEVRGEQGYRLICPEGEVVAKRLILANHIFAEEMGFMRSRVIPIATFASLTRPLTSDERRHLGDADQFGLLPASQNGSTVRLTADRRILMRNSLSYAREKHFSDSLIASVELNHRSSVRARWPALGEIEFIGTWGGVLGFTRNEGRVFGELADGLFIVLTTDAAPMTRGTACGKLLAEKLCGLESEELGIAESSPVAARLPPDPILRFLANRRIRGVETNDANER